VLLDILTNMSMTGISPPLICPTMAEGRNKPRMAYQLTLP